MNNIEIVSLHVYPIKSCGVVNLTEMKILDRGPEWDRQWMIVDENGKFLTQRQLPQMALIQPRIEHGLMHLSAPGRANHVVNVQMDNKGTSKVEVVVWKDTCLAFDHGKVVSDWLSDYLGRPARLVQMLPDFKRLLPEKYNQPSSHTGFADSLPFLLTTVESLDEINKVMPYRVAMSRFRPNIVVRGNPAFSEDSWKDMEQEISIDGLRFVAPRMATRCSIINVDQLTAQSSPEVLKGLAHIRLQDGKIYFGQNLIHLSKGTLRVSSSAK